MRLGDISQSYVEFMEDVESLTIFADLLKTLDNRQGADELFGNLKNLIEDNMDMLIHQVPQDPCGLYLQTLLNYDKCVTHFYSPKELIEGSFNAETRIFNHRGEILKKCFKDPLEDTEWGLEIIGVQTGYGGGEKIDVKITGTFKITFDNDKGLLRLNGKSHHHVSWYNMTHLCFKPIHGGKIRAHPTSGVKVYDVDIIGYSKWGQLQLVFTPKFANPSNLLGEYTTTLSKDFYYTHEGEEIVGKFYRNSSKRKDVLGKENIIKHGHIHAFRIILPIIIPLAVYDPPTSFRNDWVKKAVLERWIKPAKARAALVYVQDGIYTWNDKNFLLKAKERWFKTQRGLNEFKGDKPTDVSVSISLRLWRIQS